MSLALSVVVSVCLTMPAAAQLPSDPQPPVPPKQKPMPPIPVPPGLVKECTARIVQDNPKTKIVGPFTFGSFGNPISRWTAAKVGVVIIAAPARTPGFMDRIVKHYSGCIYDRRDGLPVFRKVAGAGEFPPRRTSVPGEE